MRIVLISSALLLSTACGRDTKYTDAGGEDARDIDASVQPIDASIDAPPPLPAYEITGGARGLSGTSHRADVQIGHGIGQQPASGAGTTAEGNAAVKR